jgi:methylglyoxal synthase
MASKERKRIAIVADHHKRKELIEWSYFNKDHLAQHELVAISETAELLEGTLQVPVTKLFTRDTGGYQQLAEMMEKGQIDMLFFFALPALARETDTDLKLLLVLAAHRDILVASNRSTTRLVFKNALKNQREVAALRSYPGFIHQTISFFNRLSVRSPMTAM